MLNTHYATIRQIQRDYKALAHEVNKTNAPTVVISNNQPQFAIISIKMLDEFQKNIAKKSAQGLIDLANWAEREHIEAPHDLSTNHDKYNYDE